MSNTMATEANYSADIGMFTIDRPIHSSCTHKTSYCEEHCYNDKLYNMYKNMKVKDIRNEKAWIDNDAKGLRKALDRKRKQTIRVRLMSRGEAFSTYEDIDRVENILEENPDTIFWIPTRAWRDKSLLIYSVLSRLDRFDNVRILASFDPSNTMDEWAYVKDKLGMSTMFFGNNEWKKTLNGDTMFKCPKTWKKMTGHCDTCKAGCFAQKTIGRTQIVHLSQH